MEQEAPPVHTMHDMWDLITGPKVMPWSSLLVQDHLGSDCRLALFQACRGGRDLVLTTAQQATLKVAATEEVHLQAAKVALITRGNLPTTLQLTASGTGQLLHALETLGNSIRWVDELQVEEAGPLPRHVLAIVGRCCPNLRALTLEAVMDQLPSRELFPNLKQLSITDPTRYSSLPDDQRLLHSQRVHLASAPYIKHLTHLTLSSSAYLATLLSPANVATHLLSLDLKYSTLDDTLLGLILQCAPALEQLTVANIELQSDTHVHTPAQWRQLHYWDDHRNLRVSSLARLPDTPPGLLLVCPDTPTLVCDTDILDDAVAARLEGRQFRWKGTEDDVYLEYVDGVDNPAAALRVALSVLHSWIEADTTQFSSLILWGKWTMTRELMIEMHLGLPHWQRLELHDTIKWMPEQPHLYESLLRLLPDSYRDVYIPCRHFGDDGFSLTPEQVLSICCGAPARTAEAPLRIVLGGCPHELFEVIQHRMQLSLIPNVVVVVVMG